MDHDYKHVTAANLSANAYVTHRGKTDSIKITGDGLHDWTSDESIVSVYFYANNAFGFDLLLKCKVSSGKSEVRISLDGKPVPNGTVTIAGNEYRTIKVCSIQVPNKGYHRIDLKGVTRSGPNFGDVVQVLFGEKSTDGSVKVMASNGNRRVPQIQLWYGLPKTTLEFFYNEVTVISGFDPIQTYFCAIGFQNGYYGIQVNSDSERRFIFSIWAPEKTNDPNKVPDESKVKLVRKGNSVNIGSFGNEGKFILDQVVMI